MKNYKKKMLIFAIACFLLAAAPAVHGQHILKGESHAPYGGRNKPRMLSRISEELDLSPEQEQQMRSNRKENLEEIKLLRGQLRDARRMLREELQRPVTDEKKINELVDELKLLQSNLIDIRVDNFLEMKEILTPQQFERFLSIKDDIKQMHRERSKRGGGMHDRR